SYLGIGQRQGVSPVSFGDLGSQRFRKGDWRRFFSRRKTLGGGGKPLQEVCREMASEGSSLGRWHRQGSPVISRQGGVDWGPLFHSGWQSIGREGGRNHSFSGAG